MRRVLPQQRHHRVDARVYQEWRRLLHHFYDPFPEVLHYSCVHPAAADARQPNTY